MDLLMIIMSSLALGAFLIWKWSSTVVVTQERARNEIFKSAWMGVVALIAFPFASIFLFLSVIGWKLGFVFLAGAALLFLVAGVVGLMQVGRWVLEQFKSKGSDNLWLQLVVGTFGVAIVEQAPLVGRAVAVLLALVVFLPTLGALAMGLLMPGEKK
jgi:uncharacterized membrane protein